MRGQKLDCMGRVGVAKRHDGRAGELRAGPQAGMGQFVDDDEIARADQCRDDAGIGKVAGTEHTCRLGALDAGEAAFELRIERMIAGHEARSARADAVARERRDRGLLDGRMVAEVEVVVAAERQQPPPVAHDPKAVETRGLGELAAQARALERIQFLCRKVVK